MPMWISQVPSDSQVPSGFQAPVTRDDESAIGSFATAIGPSDEDHEKIADSAITGSTAPTSDKKSGLKDDSKLDDYVATGVAIGAAGAVTESQDKSSKPATTPLDSTTSTDNNVPEQPSSPLRNLASKLFSSSPTSSSKKPVPGVSDTGSNSVDASDIGVSPSQHHDRVDELTSPLKDLDSPNDKSATGASPLNKKKSVGPSDEDKLDDDVATGAAAGAVAGVAAASNSKPEPSSKSSPLFPSTAGTASGKPAEPQTPTQSRSPTELTEPTSPSSPLRDFAAKLGLISSPSKNVDSITSEPTVAPIDSNEDPLNSTTNSNGQFSEPGTPNPTPLQTMVDVNAKPKSYAPTGSSGGIPHSPNSLSLSSKAPHIIDSNVDDTEPTSVNAAPVSSPFVSKSTSADPSSAPTSTDSPADAADTKERRPSLVQTVGVAAIGAAAVTASTIAHTVSDLAHAAANYNPVDADVSNPELAKTDSPIVGSSSAAPENKYLKLGHETGPASSSGADSQGPVQKSVSSPLSSTPANANNVPQSSEINLPSSNEVVETESAIGPIKAPTTDSIIDTESAAPVGTIPLSAIGSPETSKAPATSSSHPSAKPSTSSTAPSHGAPASRSVQSVPVQSPSSLFKSNATPVAPPSSDNLLTPVRKEEKRPSSGTLSPSLAVAAASAALKLPPDAIEKDSLSRKGTPISHVSASAPSTGSGNVPSNSLSAPATGPLSPKFPKSAKSPSHGSSPSDSKPVSKSSHGVATGAAVAGGLGAAGIAVSHKPSTPSHSKSNSTSSGTTSRRVSLSLISPDRPTYVTSSSPASPTSPSKSSKAPTTSAAPVSGSSFDPTSATPVSPVQPSISPYTSAPASSKSPMQGSSLTPNVNRSIDSSNAPSPAFVSAIQSPSKTPQSQKQPSAKFTTPPANANDDGLPSAIPPNYVDVSATPVGAPPHTPEQAPYPPAEKAGLAPGFTPKSSKSNKSPKSPTSVRKAPPPLPVSVTGAGVAAGAGVGVGAGAALASANAISPVDKSVQSPTSPVASGLPFASKSAQPEPSTPVDAAAPPAPKVKDESVDPLFEDTPEGQQVTEKFTSTPEAIAAAVVAAKTGRSPQSSRESKYSGHGSPVGAGSSSGVAAVGAGVGAAGVAAGSHHHHHHHSLHSPKSKRSSVSSPTSPSSPSNKLSPKSKKSSISSASSSNGGSPKHRKLSIPFVGKKSKDKESEDAVPIAYGSTYQDRHNDKLSEDVIRKESATQQNGPGVVLAGSVPVSSHATGTGSTSVPDSYIAPGVKSNPTIPSGSTQPSQAGSGVAPSGSTSASSRDGVSGAATGTAAGAGVGALAGAKSSPSVSPTSAIHPLTKTTALDPGRSASETSGMAEPQSQSTSPTSSTTPFKSGNIISYNDDKKIAQIEAERLGKSSPEEVSANSTAAKAPKYSNIASHQAATRSRDSLHSTASEREHKKQMESIFVPTSKEKSTLGDNHNNSVNSSNSGSHNHNLLRRMSSISSSSALSAKKLVHHSSSLKNEINPADAPESHGQSTGTGAAGNGEKRRGSKFANKMKHAFHLKNHNNS
ncbi:unnamed protein product [Ambrosiozyma monospora]|uniref:Unnamed protein product n=1 Tax=Ambrosiozyma monospora TaxID=43982 RepID=A0ACB5SU38_AMBMO|nr:unnamed protein product [Ambrosiozyma monospora]